MSRFTIEKVSLVCAVSLNIHNDSCPICRNQLIDKCSECANDETKINTECKSAVGVCNHGYHLHCINTWLKNKKICPLDNQRWEFLKHFNCSTKKYDNTNMIQTISNETDNNVVVAEPVIVPNNILLSDSDDNTTDFDE